MRRVWYIIYYGQLSQHYYYYYSLLHSHSYNKAFLQGKDIAIRSIHDRVYSSLMDFWPLGNNK